MPYKGAFDQFARTKATPEAYSQAAEVGLRRVFGQLAGAQNAEFPSSFPKTRLVFDLALRQLETTIEPVGDLFGPLPPGRRGGRNLLGLGVAVAGARAS